MRRRRKDRTASPDGVEEAPGLEQEAANQVSATGPFDVADHPLEEGDPSRVDLGALSIAGHPDLEIRLQVDEAAGTVVAALLVAPDGALELRPFAASRHHAMWEEVRAEILADLERQGAGASEVDGPYGKALHLVMQGQTPDGQTVTQPTLLLGIDGPRWLLRVSAYGRPATEWNSEGLLETALTQVVVVRGKDPMPPGDALTLELPPEARRQA
jgi:hypothetical protein